MYFLKAPPFFMKALGRQARTKIFTRIPQCTYLMVPAAKYCSMRGHYN